MPLKRRNGRKTEGNLSMKKINGTWFEFQHHNKIEGTYWNAQCKDFTDVQWRQKVKEISELGMEYLVLLATALDFQTYFKSSVFPQASLACEDPIEVLLRAADEFGLKVFVSVGFYGDWMNPIINMTDKEITQRGLTAMNEIVQLYGHHKSLFGWYFPDETCIEGHFSEEFISYVNCYSEEARKLNKNYKTLIAPYGTRLVQADNQYIKQLERLDISYVAYQDEVGVRKTNVEESEALYAQLYKLHEKAGRGKLWADIELFEFEGDVYQSPLLPSDFSRIEKQIQAVSPYVETILAYQYQGIMNQPNTFAFAGHISSEQFFREYQNYLRK